MKQMMKGVFILILVMVIAWATTIDALEKKELKKEFKVTITNPSHDGADVGLDMDVKGTASIPSGNYLWVLVHRTKGFKGVWWPQREAGIDPKTGEWEARVVFGVPRDIGYQFEIAVITVSGMEHQKLKAYWTKAMESGDWPPKVMPPTTSPPVIRKVNKVSH